MAKKKMSTQGKILAGLGVATVAMFSYQNIYVPNVVLEKESLVYVARDDIPAYTEVDPSMFQAVPVAERSVVSGSVTDIQSVDGKQLKGSLKAGEMLFDTRLTTDAIPEGDLLTEVKIQSTLPLKDNDNIRLFVKSTDAGNQLVVEELFNSKKVYTKNTIFGIAETGTTTEAASGMQFYLKLDQEEVLKYEEAISTGEIVAVKLLGDEEVGEAAQAVAPTDGTAVEKETKLVSDKQPVKNSESRGSVEYTVEAGDTLASIADKFVTTENEINDMNEGIGSVNEGDIILVPAI